MLRVAALGQALKVAAMVCLLAATVSSWGQGIPGYPGTVEGFDPREIALLPRYCVYTDTFRSRVPLGNNPQMIAQWHAHMGRIFEAMHHYCYGLMKTNRATLLAQDATTRRFYLLDSITEFDYVISRAPADFVLLPEILSKKGENLIRLDKGPAGMQELERAIELNPNYWPPYAHMSDYFKSKGEIKTAREWLEKGLVTSPDARGLTRRLAELDAPETRNKKKH